MKKIKTEEIEKHIRDHKYPGSYVRLGVQVGTYYFDEGVKRTKKEVQDLIDETILEDDYMSIDTKQTLKQLKEQVKNIDEA